MKRVYNFSAGPAVLPEEVLKEAAEEMLDYQGTGMSVMEMSHRSKAFEKIITEAEQDLRDLMNAERFKAILERCGIRNAHFHTLRHTFATRCIEVGFDVKSLSEILGHANVSITLNRYVHPSMELKQKNMDKLSELFAVK